MSAWKQKTISETNGLDHKKIGVGYRVMLPFIWEFKLELVVVNRPMRSWEEGGDWQWAVNLHEAGKGLSRFVCEGRSTTCEIAMSKCRSAARGLLRGARNAARALASLKFPMKEERDG